jgi:hypothetical protein
VVVPRQSAHHRVARRSAIRKITTVLVFAMVMILTGVAHATLVTFTVDPALIGPPISTIFYDVFSTGLNGTPLNGQHLSLDLVYADDVLARVQGSSRTGMLLVLSTNAPFHCQEFPGFGTLCGNYPGFPVTQTQTGYMLAPDGGPLQAPVAEGGAMSNDGDLAVGIDRPIPGGNYETSGLHLDFGLPDSDSEVTGAKLRLVTDGTVQFGTAAQLSDGDSLIPIASCVMLGALFIARFFATAGHRTAVRLQN